jgi:sporulation protein YlmC with PRC-barrel domain
MIKMSHAAVLSLSLFSAGTFMVVKPVRAQVAGSTTVGVSLTEVAEIASGWSAKNNLFGKTVYNESGAKVGVVEDLIVAPNKSVSYLIVGAGGFVGIGRHDVAIPVVQIAQKDGKFIMAGATKEAILAMPQFNYASDRTALDQFVAKADQDISQAKSKLAKLEDSSKSASAAAKAKLDEEMGGMKRDLKSAEDKLGELNRAGIKHWKNFQGEVSMATARLRKWAAPARP